MPRTAVVSARGFGALEEGHSCVSLAPAPARAIAGGGYLHPRHVTGSRSSEEELQRLVEQSCMQRSAQGGNLGAVALQARLLELCGFAPNEANPQRQAVRYEGWGDEGWRAHLVAAPLEALLLEVAIGYLTPARLIRNVLQHLVDEPDAASRGALLEVA